MHTTKREVQMRKRLFVLISAWLVAGCFLNGCEDEPTGACVSDPYGGMTVTCSDGVKKSDCSFGFDTFREGKTCKELGFSSTQIVDADSCNCAPHSSSDRRIFNP
jgi:hypothetical protein